MPEPGTFAFIVGVSKYKYLDGSKESLTLGQLAVSALTAYQLFRYFAESYRHRIAPIAEVTLLLSPTAHEQKLFDTQSDYPITPQTAPAPTLRTLCEALQGWYARLAALEPEAAKMSRLFFFFSGHGLELAPSQQLLLPHDYPGPARMYNNAISTENIHAGLGALKIPEQFFFIDACRNDIASLHELAMSAGVPALDIKRRQEIRTAPILSACAPSASTFQPDEANDLGTISFFGQALLDVLLLRDESFQPDCRTKPCKVEFFPLFDYANANMARLLMQPGSTPLTAGGIVRNATVSHVSVKTAPRTASAPAASAIAPVSPPLRNAAGLQPIYAIAVADRDIKHALHDARIYDWDDDWRPSAPAIEVATQHWSEDARSFNVEFRFERSDRWHLVWFEHQAIDYASIFPAGFAEDPLFEVTFDLAHVQQSDANTIANVRAGLSPRNPPDLAAALAAWNPSASLTSTSIDETDLPTNRLAALLDEAPLAGTLAALALLRRGEFETLRPLLDRFANPRLPMSDLPVIGLRLMALQSEWEESALRACLTAIGRLGIPATHEAAQYLVSFLLNQLPADDADPGGFGSDRLRRVALEAVAEARPMLDDFSRVGPVMRSGGLFITLVASSEKMATYVRTFS